MARCPAHGNRIQLNSSAAVNLFGATPQPDCRCIIWIGRFNDQLGTKRQGAVAVLRVRTCQRSRCSREASGLSTEPSGRRTGGAIEELPATDLIGPGQKAHQQAATAGAGFPAGWSHVDQVPSSVELEHRIWIGGTDGSELLRAEAKIRRQLQRRQSIGPLCWRSNGHGPNRNINSS